MRMISGFHIYITYPSVAFLLMIYTPLTIAGGMYQSGNEILISNEYATIILNTNGAVESVMHKEKQYAKAGQHYFSQIHYDYHSVKLDRANSISLLPNNILEIHYADSPAKLQVKVIVHDKYFSFKTIKAIDFPATVKLVRFFQVNFKYRFTNNRIPLIQNSTDETLFMNTLPMNTETRTSYNYAQTNIRAGFENSQAAVIIIPKVHYYDAVKTLIADYELPDSRMDGAWFRESQVPDESYLFAKITKSNYLDILDYSKKMKVKNLLMLTPFIMGHYNTPRRDRFSNIEEMYNACDKFTEAGIKLGIHAYFSRVSWKDPFFRNPARNLLKYEIGMLQSGIDSSSTEITLSNFLDSNTEFTLYSKGSDSILIGDEVIRFSKHSGKILRLKQRGYHSRKASHAAGDKVYILPYDLGAYYLNTENHDVVKEYVDSLSAVIEHLQIKFLYYDGNVYPSIPETMGRGDDWVNLSFKYGIMPLVKEIGTENIRYQFGGRTNAFNYYFSSRAASNDGVEYGNKAFTREYKLPAVNNPNISSYGATLREFGWWKIHGSQITLDSKDKDTDAVTLDAVHYIMLKAVALQRGVGIQLASRYASHGKMDQLLTTIGLYNDFADLDKQKPQVSEAYRKYLMRPEVEGELQKHDTGFKIVEKRSKQQYAHWEAGSPYNFHFQNHFTNLGRTKIHIRPRFDYYPYVDNRHDVIEDFSDVSDWNVTTINNEVTCSVSDGGVITLQNSGDAANWCKLTKILPKTQDLSGKRGLGLSLEGSSGSEMMIVQLSGYAPGLPGQFGVRDYMIDIDFTGTRQLVLGNPAATIHDVARDQKNKFLYSPIKRFWTFNYSKVQSINIYINDIIKGDAYKIKVNELKALQEKGDSVLVNPGITINANSVTFPETLSIKQNAPYLIEYDGETGNYEVFDSDYNLLSNGKNKVMSIDEGSNVISITSDMSDQDYSSRAIINVSVYDTPRSSMNDSQ